jgi:RHS repeat-associated protein
LLSTGLGSTSVLSNSGGTKINGSEARYLPFGGYRTTPTTNPAVTDRGFTGQKHNNSLGLIYYNAKFYVPYINRHISPDPIVPQVANPQSLNRYSYVYNNPVRYTDSSGHCIDGITTWVCLGVAATAIDKGWTAYDMWQSSRVIGNANASRDDKVMAGLNVAVSLVFEIVEPEEVLGGLGLPIDDVARKVFMRLAGDAFAEGGEAGLKGFIRDQLGNHADAVINKVDDIVGAFCSFSGDTLVMTEDGLVPMSEVELWDNVLAYNEETGEIGYYPVTAVWEHLDPIIVTLTIDGEQIETTPEHPFYTATGDWLAAADLQIGDEIRTAKWGTGTVEANHFTIASQPMYNFTVATAHTYFVGDGQWLVHNACNISPQINTFLGDSMNMDELKTLYFNLGYDFEDIVPQNATKSDAIALLIT